MKCFFLAMYLVALAQAQSMLLQNWAGDVGTYSGTIPTYADRPDNGLAVGPTQVVQLTGQDFTIWAKFGGAQVQRISTQRFFGNAGAGFTSACFDPRIYFDPFIGPSGRYVAMCTDSGSGIDCYCVSAGTDATSGSNSNWKCNTVPSSGQKDDTMRAGFDVNGFVICRFQSGTAFYCYAFNNMALAWSGLSGPGSYVGFSMATPYDTFPAIDLNANKPPDAPNLMIARTGPFQTGTNAPLNILVNTLTWSGATPRFSSTKTITSPGWLYNTPANGTQPGNPSTYYLGESHRVVPPTWDPSGNVWFTVESGPCQSSCGSLPSNGQTGFYWGEIDPVALSLTQGGYQFTTDSLSFQSIVTDRSNITHIITQLSSSSMPISLAEYYRLPTDPAGTLRGPYVRVAGKATYPQGCGADSLGAGVSYNTGVLDYYNQGIIWATGELGLYSMPCKWATWVMQLSYRLPPKRRTR